MNVEDLRKLYKTNEAAKALCDDMAARDRSQTETKLKRILARLKNDGHEVKKSEMIAAFRKLEELDCGEYVEGRHGWPSRFVWSVGSKSACSAAAGETTVVQPLATGGELDEEETEILTHTLHLRADFEAKFELPIDLTSTESERLAAFIKCIPLEEYE